MTSTTWMFLLNTSTDFTSSVLSANINSGRQKYLDNYNGGSINITINNNTNLASSFNFNDKIYATVVGSTGNYQNVFSVQEILFDDYPGNTGLSTATIVAVDGLTRVGRYQATSKALTQDTTGNQAMQFNGSPLPADIVVGAFAAATGNSTASAQTYTGTVLNQLNILNATERGLMSSVGNVSNTQLIYFFSRSWVNTLIDTAFSFGRTTSATKIAYGDIKRIQNGMSFINTAQISPLGLSNSNRTNTTSINNYGSAFYSSSTVDYDTTQADGNGDWIVNTFSDPANVRYEISFTDRMQNSSAYFEFSRRFFTSVKVWSLEYLVPGDVSVTTIKLVNEGFTINVTPEQTQYQIFFSPLDYYQFFTLDSITQGILNTSRLGW
jgi:hypothetical protein